MGRVGLNHGSGLTTGRVGFTHGSGRVVSTGAKRLLIWQDGSGLVHFLKGRVWSGADHCLLGQVKGGGCVD